MKDLPLNMLRAFAAVYESGGIRPAARRLEVTHSSVIRFVRELEAWLGIPLIDRREGRRSITFTPEGESLGKAVLSSYSGLAAALEALRESRNANAVVIETTPSFAVRWLLPKLGVFEETFAWIELSVVVEQRMADPRESGADLSIRMGQGPWRDGDAVPFLNDALYPVMAPDYWRTIGEPREIEALAGCRLLHDRDPNTPWSLWKTRYGPKNLRTREGPRYSSSDLVLQAAEEGLGVALARHQLVASRIATGALVAPFGTARIELPDAYWIVTPRDRPEKAAVQQVIEWLKGYAGVNGPEGG